MAISGFFLLVMAAVFLLLFVGGIVALVSLLSSEKGRTIFKVLLIVPVMLLLMGFLTVGLARMRAERASHDRDVRMAADDFDRHDHWRGGRGGRGHRGDRDLPEVSGTVRCNGEPVFDGTIRFISTSSTLPGLAPSTEIIDGKYSALRIPAGTYRVEIEAVRTDGAPEGSELPESVQFLPAKYNVASALVADVRDGTNTFDFDLAADLDPKPIDLGAAEAVTVVESDPAPEADDEPDEELPVLEEPIAVGDRPAWADWEEYALHKVPGACRMVVRVGPYETREECDQELPDKLRAAVGEYAAVYLEPKARKLVRLPPDYVQTNIVQNDWAETKDVVITPAGQIPEKSVPMVWLNVLLEFDPAANSRIREVWDDAVVADRIFGLGALTAIVLALLAGVYGYLEIDLVTGGAYRRHLRLAAVGVVLTLLAAGGLFLYLAAAHSTGAPIV